MLTFERSLAIIGVDFESARWGMRVGCGAYRGLERRRGRRHVGGDGVPRDRRRAAGVRPNRAHRSGRAADVLAWRALMCVVCVVGCVLRYACTPAEAVWRRATSAAQRTFFANGCEQLVV